MNAIHCLFTVGEITVNYSPDWVTPRHRVTCSRDMVYAFREIWPDSLAHRECFYIACLSRNNEVIGCYRVSEGGTSGTVADPKIIFQVALGCNASSIILAHNHPSGSLTPSQADRDLTTKLRETGRQLDCPVLDHLILTQQSYLSFADEGIL
jgi:DNA repair protein RadC